MNHGMDERVALDANESGFNTSQELLPQSWRLFLVPCVGLLDIRLGLWDENGRLAHSFLVEAGRFVFEPTRFIDGGSP